MARQFAGDTIGAIWGQRRDLTITNPAAGADWTLTFAGGYRYRLLLATWVLKTSAQVPKRFPALQVKDGDGFVRLQVADTGEVAASVSARVSVGRGLSSQASSSGLAFTMAAPSVLFEPGWSVNSLTTGIQTEDQLEGIRILWEELMDPYPGFPSGVPHLTPEDLATVEHAHVAGHPLDHHHA